MKTRLPSRLVRHAFVSAIFALLCVLGRVQAGVTFGDTIEQCDAAFGPTVPVPSASFLVCAQTRGYVKDGLSIFVGFTEKGLVEEFIYSKVADANESTALSEAEQNAILDKYKDASSWVLNEQQAPSGPVWHRADSGAYASYVFKGRRLVILSNEGMAEHLKKFHVEDGKKPETP